MRAMTKAKRRVTLSICGLGLLSEDELDTMPGVQTFDAEADTKLDQQAASAYPSRREEINRDVPLEPTPPQRTRGSFLDALEIAMRHCGSLDAVNKLIASADVQRAMQTFTNGHKTRLDSILAAGIGAHAPVTHEEEDSGWPGPVPGAMADAE